jgi:hypothetical protein
MESDRFRWTLVHTGPAFNAIPRIDRIGFIFLYFIDLAGTDLSTVSTTIAFFLIYERMHDLNPIFLAFSQNSNGGHEKAKEFHPKLQEGSPLLVDFPQYS